MITSSRPTSMVTYNRRPRSLWGNVSSVLLQPVVFYQSFPFTRQWLWIGLLILAVTGFSAVHQPTTDASQSAAPVIDMQSLPPDIAMGGGGGLEGGFIPPGDLGTGQAIDNRPNTTEIVMTALLAAGGVVLAWAIQSVLLAEVSLINGKLPSLGRNFQIAIWASVPLALMLIIQQIYFAAGGQAGQPGVSLLLERWAGFQTLPAFSRAALTALASNFTFFWLWNLALLYVGGRHVLNGRRTAVILVIVIWIIISTLLPALNAPGDPEIVVPDTLELDSGAPPSDGEMMMPDGDQRMLTPAPEAESESLDSGSIRVLPPVSRGGGG